MMNPSAAFDKFSLTNKPLARKLSIKDNRVNELLETEPGVTYSPRFNMEVKARQEDRSSNEVARGMSTSSSPLQDVARFALQAMEKLRMDGSEVTPGLGFGRRTSMLRPYHGGPQIQSVDGSSFMSPKDIADGAEISGSIHAKDLRDVDATGQSLVSDMHVGQQGMPSRPIPGKRKRGRPPKTDLSRLSISQNNPSKKRRFDGEGSNGNFLASSPIQGSVIEASEVSGHVQSVKSHKKKASILKPISENAPKRRGRPPKKHLNVPTRQPIPGELIQDPNDRGFQNRLNVIMAPESQEGLNPCISDSGHGILQESNGFALPGGDPGNNSARNTVAETTVKKRGPGRPRKSEKILPSIEFHHEDLASYESGIQDVSRGNTNKSEQDQLQKTEDLQPFTESKSTKFTAQTETPVNVNGGEEQRIDLYVEELAPLKPNPVESVSKEDPPLPPREIDIPTAPQSGQRNWTSEFNNGASNSESQSIELSHSQSTSQERNVTSDLAAAAVDTVIVKKRRGRPPKNKSTIATFLLPPQNEGNQEP